MEMGDMAGIVLLLTFVASLWHERDLEKAAHTLLKLSLWSAVIRAELKDAGKDPEVHHTATTVILPDACLTWEQLC